MSFISILITRDEIFDQLTHKWFDMGYVLSLMGTTVQIKKNSNGTGQMGQTCQSYVYF